MNSEKSKLVLRANELFHDYEESGYDNKHDDIFIDEKERWERIGKNFLDHRSDQVITLDIGSGTGFVPLHLAQFLKKEDFFYCSDISQKILDVCKNKLEKESFKCDFKFIKTDGIGVNLPSESVDFITLNSVLHHIPDFQIFFQETNRLLKKNGKIIIGHEANQLFFSNKLLWINYKIFDSILNPKRTAINIIKKIGLFGPLRKLYLETYNKKGKHDEIIEKINKQLIEEGLIKNTLNGDEIFALIDIHSPASTISQSKEKGFDLEKIRETYLPNFEMEYLETYNHFGKISSRNSLFRKFDLLLKKVYPTEGSSFMVVFTKK